MPAESFDLQDHKVKRSKMSRNRVLPVLFVLLCVVLLIVTVALIVMLVFWATGRFKTTPATPTLAPGQTTLRTSNTQGFVQAALILKRSIDTSANPCQDFYKYACGQWMSDHPPGQSVPRQVSKLTATNLGWLLRNNSHLSNETQAVQVAGMIYRSCVNRGSNQITGKKNPILGLISQFGGWPLLNETYWQPLTSPWALAGKLSGRFRISTLLSTTVHYDWINTTRNVIYLDQPNVGLGTPIYYLQQKYLNTVVAAYKRLIRTTVTILANYSGIPTPRDLGQDITDIFNFEQSLAGYIDTSSKRKNFQAMDNRFKYTTLLINYNKIGWADYFGNLLGKALPFSLIPDNEAPRKPFLCEIRWPIPEV